MRKKITSTVQVLTHLKEKLQFVYAENQVLKGHLYEVEVEAARVSCTTLIGKQSLLYFYKSRSLSVVIIGVNLSDSGILRGNRTSQTVYQVLQW